MTGRTTAAEPRWGRLVLSWVAAASTRAPLIALGPVLPMVIADLGLSFTLAGTLQSLPLVLMGLLAIPGGFVADRFGGGRVIALGLVAVAVAGGARAATTSSAALVATTVALGAAIGIMQPAMAEMARDAWPRRVGFTTAIYSNGFVMGTYLAPALAPTLLTLSGSLSWRGVLLVWALFSALGGAVAAWSARGERGDPRARMGGWAGLLDVYRTPGVATLTIVLGTQSAVFYGLGAWLPAYLHARGWTIEDSAGPLSVVALAAIPAGLLAPSLVDVVGRRPLLLLAGLVTLVSQVGFLVLTNEAVWVWAACAGVGTTVAFTVGLTGPAVLAPPGRIGATTGAMLALTYAGSMVGPFAVGALRDALGSFEAGFSALVALALALTVSTAVVPEHRSVPSPAAG